MAHSVRIPPAKAAARVALAGATILALAQGASAEEGFGNWLSSMFGGGSAPVVASRPSAPAPTAPALRAARHWVRLDGFGRAGRSEPAPAMRWRARPLVVRLHRRAAGSTLAQVPIKPAIVSIYLDRTLRRGDAVMMGGGMRVFAGSGSWPHSSADFVAVADAKHMSRSTTKLLSDLDLLPRG